MPPGATGVYPRREAAFGRCRGRCYLPNVSRDGAGGDSGRRGLLTGAGLSAMI